jgi:hypothetical protein
MDMWWHWERKKLMVDRLYSESGCSFHTWTHKASRPNVYVQHTHDMLPCVSAVRRVCLLLTIRMRYVFQDIASLLHANTRLLWHRTGFCLSVDVTTFRNYIFTEHCMGQWLQKWRAMKLLPAGDLKKVGVLCYYSLIFLSTVLSARFCPRILLHNYSTCPANTINLNLNTGRLKWIYIDLLCTSQRTQGASLRKSKLLILYRKSIIRAHSCTGWQNAEFWMIKQVACKVTTVL